jgi:creatinine amidohydrolase/Fe(II)-dependent formamide hydrolase-like protein
MFARALALLLLSQLAVFAGVARADDSVFIDDLTSTELQALVRDGRTIALVPIGGTEQNGPHMALGKHNVRVKALAEKIARALGNALVAPVIAYVPEGSVNPPTSHMRFAGTLTVPAATFESVLEYAARSLRASGFHDIFFVGDHGGYQHSEEAVAQRLNREWARTPARAHALTEYYRVTETQYRQALKSRGYTDAEIGTHAGVADTSLALAIDPRLVRAAQLGSASSLDAAHGVYGDPRRASADLGRLGVETIVRRSVESIRRATAHR